MREQRMSGKNASAYILLTQAGSTFSPVFFMFYIQLFILDPRKQNSDMDDHFHFHTRAVFSLFHFSLRWNVLGSSCEWAVKLS